MEARMDLKKAFAIAMKGEIEGRELYKMVSERTDDPQAKEVFTYLAQEEQKHFEALEKMYHSTLKGEEIEIPSLPRLVRFEDVESPIFSKDFKMRIGESHFEMSALSIALRLERDASDFYKQMAEESSISGLKKFFSGLAAWEEDHYRAIYKEIQFLEEEYYQKNNFSPF
jgi:rubrerythrin